MSETSRKIDEKSFVNNFLKYMPLMQWVMTIIIAIAVVALSQRDSQTAQAQTVAETKNRVTSIEQAIDKKSEARDRQIDSFRKEILTREVFDAYHKADSDRMDRVEKMIQQLLENNNR